MTEITFEKLKEFEGNKDLSGIRSGKIARVLLMILPFFLLVLPIMAMKGDLRNGLISVATAVSIVLIVAMLYHGRKRVNRMEVDAEGIRFLPAGIFVPEADIRKIEYAPNPNGGDIIILHLNTRRLIPYFGLVWCFGRTLAINTEPEEKPGKS